MTKTRLGWIHASDDQRAVWRGPSIARFIDFWELIRRQRAWTSLSKYASARSSQRRWVRRQIKYLAAAGLVEMRGGGTGSVIRFRRAKPP